MRKHGGDVRRVPFPRAASPCAAHRASNAASSRLSVTIASTRWVEKRRQALVVVDRDDARLLDARACDLLEVAAAIDGDRPLRAIERAQVAARVRPDDEHGLGVRDRCRHHPGDEAIGTHRDAAHHHVEVAGGEPGREVGPVKRHQGHGTGTRVGVGAGDLHVEAGEACRPRARDERA